jgi:rhodanese-related sulfurtransferase
MSKLNPSELPEGKRTTLGLYVSAAEAYEMWKSAPDKVKVIDVRTPEEYAFVGHPEMSWNIPIAFVSYQRKGGRFEYGPRMNPDFVDHVLEVAAPTDVLLVTCRSGGRSAMAVNDGVEGDLVHDPDSVFDGKRMKNGWKNSAPWVYSIDPERIIIEEGTSKRTQ